MESKSFAARLVENRHLGGTSFVLRLAGCEALRDAQPGQFVMLRGEWGRDPLLPRAFSILRTLPDGGAEILGKAVGRGTRLLLEAAAGQTLHVLGPLGRPWPRAERGRAYALVAGGVGLAPLLMWAEAERDAGADIHLFYGARTAADLVLVDECERAGCRVTLATEDGSRGLKGRVTDALVAAAPSPDTIVLTCGPNPMMRAVAAIAAERTMKCLVSVEGEMACGIGVCLGCAVPHVEGAPRKFGYACVDGPVFDAAEIVLP
jgi:dihydroorotate dehydrogenase electron transfer subunit